jgi:cysteine sulfinate desulfinase/cysteine desulfurase-like protein
MTASQQIADTLGAKVLEEINFTPGETEANNLAMMGALAANPQRAKNLSSAK